MGDACRRNGSRGTELIGSVRFRNVRFGNVRSRQVPLMYAGMEV